MKGTNSRYAEKNSKANGTKEAANTVPTLPTDRQQESIKALPNDNHFITSSRKSKQGPVSSETAGETRQLNYSGFGGNKAGSVFGQ